jgi:hypothetical protein
MRKIILFLVLITAFCRAQQFRPANLEVPIIATDSIFKIILTVGIDSTATDGIDLHLGENPIFILTPGGVFDARLFLPVDTASNKDFRKANSFPFTGTKEHHLRWQLTSGTIEFIIILMV